MHSCTGRCLEGMKNAGGGQLSENIADIKCNRLLFVIRCHENLVKWWPTAWKVSVKILAMTLGFFPPYPYDQFGSGAHPNGRRGGGDIINNWLHNRYIWDIWEA